MKGMSAGAAAIVEVASVTIFSVCLTHGVQVARFWEYAKCPAAMSTRRLRTMKGMRVSLFAVPMKRRPLITRRWWLAEPGLSIYRVASFVGFVRPRGVGGPGPRLVTGKNNVRYRNQARSSAGIVWCGTGLETNSMPIQ